MLIQLKIHFKSNINEVFYYLSTAEGRASFWAEEAREKEGYIHFKFINGWSYQSRILECIPDEKYAIEYFHSKVTFILVDDQEKGTIMTIINSGVKEKEFCAVYAGWVSVLMAMKASCDYDIDLRNHHPGRTWDEGFVNN